MIFLIIAALLAGCGHSSQSAEESASNGSTNTAATTTLSGVASHGDPLAGASVTVLDASGAVLGTASTSADGSYALTTQTAFKTPLSVQVISADGSLAYQAIAFATPGTSSTINVNPISNLLATAELNSVGANISSATFGNFASYAGQLTATGHEQAIQSINAILLPIAQQIAQSDTTLAAALSASNNQVATALLAQPITGLAHTGLDNLLDQLQIGRTGNGQAQISLSAAPSQAPMVVPLSSIAELVASASTNTAQAKTIATAAASQLTQPPPTVILSAASSWGSASDSWAGYTGALALWLPSQVSGGWSLSFQSATLGKQAAVTSFWGAKAAFDPTTNTFTLSNQPYNSSVSANTVIAIGFSASGALGANVDLTNCKFNGRPCALTFQSATSSQATLQSLLTNFGVSNTAASTISGTVSSALQSATQTAAQNAQTTNPSSTVGGATQVVSTSSTPSVSTSSSDKQLTFAVTSTWQGGYGANLTIKNTSSSALPAGGGWSVTLNFGSAASAADVFQSGPWNLQIKNNGDGTVTLSPQSWSAAVLPGGTITSGFNGGSAANIKLATSSNATIVFDPSVTQAITGQTVTTSTPAPSGAPSVVTPPTSPANGASGTASNTASTGGSPPGGGTGTSGVTGTASGFIYSPYKDVSISMNWNTNVISTAVNGTLTPLLTTLPSKVHAVTLAFATGECGKESWGGIDGANIAAANVASLAAADIDYIVSTGGAAGAFSCGSDAGMTTFIKRYASKNLVGIDFDIEAGQTQEVINGLVQRAVQAQQQFPNLRFSFTLATLASSSGGMSAVSAGTGAQNSFNIYGNWVMQAIRAYGLVNYTINLMVMDYGAPNSGNCVVANGACQMGQSAIQAAMNLHDYWKVPYSQIELTPMIGGNDVIDETFSLVDVDTVVDFARRSGLAGVHFWSFDRDRDCAPGYASPTCNTIGTVGTLGYTNRFANAFQ